MSLTTTLLVPLMEFIIRMSKRKKKNNRHTYRNVSALTTHKTKNRTPRTMTVTVEDFSVIRDTTMLTILNKTKALIETPEKWCFEAIAKDAEGNRLSITKAAAGSFVPHSFCLTGAILYSARDMQLKPNEIDAVRRAFNTLSWYLCGCPLITLDSNPQYGFDRAHSFISICSDFFRRQSPFDIGFNKYKFNQRPFRHERLNPDRPTLPFNPVPTPLSAPTVVNHETPIFPTLESLQDAYE